MTIYHLYQTGIKIASFRVANQEIFVTQLDFMSGQWLPEVSLNQQHIAFFTRYIRNEFGDFIQRLAEYHEFVQKTKKPDFTKTSWGAVYSEADSHLWVERQKKHPLDIVVAEERFVGFVMTNREFTSIFIEEGFEAYTVLKEWQQQGLILQQPAGIEERQTAMIEMRDGVKLATEFWLPAAGSGPYPVILARTPYGKESYSETHYRFVQRGYAVVIQDVRGRNDSQGEWQYFEYDEVDGADTLEWIASQVWCDGEIGMLGGSYGGYVQWAAAASGSPHLKAIVSIVTAGGPFTDMRRKNGAMISGGMALEFALSQKKMQRELMIREDWDELMRIRPLEKIPEVGLGHEIPSFNRALAHDCYDEFWEPMNWLAKKDQIKVPALIISGWFDDNGTGTTEAIEVTNAYPLGQRKIILGPWLHNGNSIRDLGKIPLGNTALRHDIDLQHIMWFERFLRHVENGINQEPSVEYFTINENKWKTASQFPPEYAAEHEFYLTSGGQANTSKGDGQLMLQLPTINQKDCFSYDPLDPAPHLIDLSENEITFPNDYHEVEKREDLLCYTTETFTQPQIITGQFKVGFYASSSAINTDWVVRLTDVSPNGTSFNLAEGLMCARFYKSFSQPEFLIPEKIYYFEIETSIISALLQENHKLRLSITSSAENYIFPNSNTKDGVNSLVTEIAQQVIYTGPDYPSKLTVRLEEPLTK